MEWLGRVGGLLTALVAALALLSLTRGLYRKTLGRRRDRYARLARLGTNAQVSFFESVLGDPPAMRRSASGSVTAFDDAGEPYAVPKTWTECIWIDRDFYVHAVADEDETIHAYSVTTRSRRFRPTLRQPGGTWVERGRIARMFRRSELKRMPKVKLGKTRFHELGRPEHAASWMGMHNLHYFEAYWGANPGLYQWFVYSINDAGYAAWEAGWDFQRMQTFWWGFEDEIVDPQLRLAQIAIRADQVGELLGDEASEATEAEESDEVVESADIEEVGNDDETEEPIDEPLPRFYEGFRRQARINTYTVIGPELPLDDYPFLTKPPHVHQTTFGPSSVRTRTLAHEPNRP